MKKIFSLTKRVAVFALRYSKYPRFVAAYAVLFFQKNDHTGAKFYSKEELLKHVHEGKSFVRFGDGETFIMHGGSLAWQENDPQLAEDMRQVIREYGHDSPYVIGLPKFINESNRALRYSPEGNKMFVWMPVKAMYKTMCRKDMVYADAHVFYYDNFFQEYFEPFLMDKHIILVAHKQYIEEAKANTKIPFKHITYVEAPKQHAYRAKNALIEELDAALHALPAQSKPVIIFTIGPASKPLVYRFSKLGTPSYDLGRGIENFYKDESLEEMYPELTRNKKE